MKKYYAMVIAMVMFVAFVCPSVIAAPRKVTKPAQNVENSTETVNSINTKAINKQDMKVNIPPVDKTKQAGDTKSTTGIVK